MIHQAADPLSILGNRQGERRVAMAAERARHRNEPVADKPVAEAAGFPGGGRRDRVARDVLGQRDASARIALMRETIAALPILVDEVAVAKVGDAGAADPAEPGERGRIGDFSKDEMDPAADSFKRRSVVRRAEKDELAQTPRQPCPAASP